MTHALPLVPAPDPFDTCARFSGLPYLLFLDSSAQGALSRYSFLAADPVAVARSPEAARELLRAERPPRTPLADLPPFQGGIAGYIGYEWGAALERVQRPAPDGITPQMPQRQPRERDQALIDAWVRRDWPRVKKRRGICTQPLVLRTKAGSCWRR